MGSNKDYIYFLRNTTRVHKWRCNWCCFMNFPSNIINRSSGPFYFRSNFPLSWASNIMGPVLKTLACGVWPQSKVSYQNTSYIHENGVAKSKKNYQNPKEKKKKKKKIKKNPNKNRKIFFFFFCQNENFDWAKKNFQLDQRSFKLPNRIFFRFSGWNHHMTSFVTSKPENTKKESS